MKHVLLSLIVFVLVPQLAFGEQCGQGTISGVPFEICISDESASGNIAGIEFNVSNVSQPKAWELKAAQIKVGNTQLLKIRFQVNSGGPFRDELIAEICANNPIHVSWRGSGLELGRMECSKWIRLGPFPYVGPH
jgi:hypothetical protein